MDTLYGHESATKPPATKPPATKPPATKPPATKPPATNPENPTAEINLTGSGSLFSFNT